jgi:RNA polymerase sigma factor (sigma-70 family)
VELRLPLDADDIADLYARHAREIVGFFARRTYDPEVAVDLMAETFAIVVAERRRFRGDDREAARAWLYGIARHQFSGWVRRAKVERSALRRLGIASPQLSDTELDRIVEMAGVADLRREVTEQLSELSADHRTVLQLRIIEELPYDAVAERLGVTEQTARARVSRALRALNHALVEAGHGA